MSEFVEFELAGQDATTGEEVPVYILGSLASDVVSIELGDDSRIVEISLNSLRKAVSYGGFMDG